jgi:hypothetical protein
VKSSTIATVRESPSTELEKPTSSSPGFGSRPPCTSSNTAGITSAPEATINIVAWERAAVRLKTWRSRRMPPTNIAPPRTNKMLPRTEPMIDALTTSCSPSSRAKIAMRSSGKLPNVTLSRPPMPGPARSASSSVALPMSAAVGITPRADTAKITAGAA